MRNKVNRNHLIIDRTELWWLQIAMDHEMRPTVCTMGGRLSLPAPEIVELTLNQTICGDDRSTENLIE